MTSLWSIVLAGGRGARLSALTGGVPKQFWCPSGNRSLLEATLARLAPLTEPSRTVTVVVDTHHSYVEQLQERAAAGDVLYQPDDRGTATGVLLASVVVATCDPGAIVVVTPADHGVQNDEEFRAGVRVAADHVQTHRGEVVLLGVEPQSPTGDYGWIVTTPGTSGRMSAVASFVEKPPAASAARLFASGAVWNTMVLVARVEAILSLYRQLAPDLAAAFEGFRFLPPSQREQQLRRLYEHLPTTDFSQDVLTHARGLLCLAWRATMGWTDLGTPERLAAWLETGGGGPVTASARSRPMTGWP